MKFLYMAIAFIAFIVSWSLTDWTRQRNYKNYFKAFTVLMILSLISYLILSYHFLKGVFPE